MSPIELIDEILDSVECDEVSVEQAIVQLRLIGISSSFFENFDKKFVFFKISTNYFQSSGSKLTLILASFDILAGF